jgi:hypothetical protein
MTLGSLRDLLPGTLVKDAVRLELDAFLALYGTTPLLLVRLAEGEKELRAGLESSWLPAATRGAAQVAPMRFRTELLRAHREGAPAPGALSREHDGVLPALEKAIHFAAILRSKSGTGKGPIGPQRISLGRATNNDVVLRHTSVSKFHASLEPMDDGTVKIVDTGSTNRTSVNDVTLPSRAPVEARSGDRLRFGSVEAILWSPRALWASQHDD